MERGNSLEKNFGFACIYICIDPFAPCCQTNSKSFHAIHVFHYLVTYLDIIPSAEQAKGSSYCLTIVRITTSGALNEIFIFNLCISYSKLFCNEICMEKVFLTKVKGFWRNLTVAWGLCGTTKAKCWKPKCPCFSICFHSWWNQASGLDQFFPLQCQPNV